MHTGTDAQQAESLLRTDMLRHVVTLRMIRRYASNLTTSLTRSARGWALRTMLPAHVSHWDRGTYPFAKAIVFIDGTDPDLKIRMLEELPIGTFVVKTYDDAIKRRLRARPTARLAASYLSFTTAARPQRSTAASVQHGSCLSDDLLDLFHRNGYGAEEMAKEFAAGARWFAISDGGRLCSGCFICQNYDRVWEIAGVHTRSECRRNGYAKRVVAAALGYLLDQGLVPRYQVKAENTASISLAVDLGFTQFLHIDHYVVSDVDPLPVSAGGTV